MFLCVFENYSMTKTLYLFNACWAEQWEKVAWHKSHFYAYIPPLRWVSKFAILKPSPYLYSILNTNYIQTLSLQVPHQRRKCWKRLCICVDKEGLPHTWLRPAIPNQVQSPCTPYLNLHLSLSLLSCVHLNIQNCIDIRTHTSYSIKHDRLFSHFYQYDPSLCKSPIPQFPRSLPFIQVVT